ncbi:replicative DNA helicase [Succiniclasticum ruminis]|uniref:DNA 5'-3' helicase n=1 Tax=Succiniclasticum ruminis DSM 9236 TaxID=1123323 RepID=A0A1I2DCF8_9FIRM|nr:replicative DNA helicase [Succiniclasticum ruminis]SFE78214.1 replicative DNA helicase [Succiniclasticum ruminis DSM 9236]
MQEKIIPQNISAEQNVLCAMLIDNKAVGTVSGILKPDDFYRQAHQVIYRAMLNLYGRSEPVDLVTVIEELRKMNKLQEVGDVSYITLLGEVAPTAANVKFHAQIVADKAMQRQLIESGTVIASLGYECPDGEIRNAVDSAQKQLLELTGRRRGRDFVPIQEIVESTVDRMGSMVESDEPVTGLRTGFTDLDEVTAGLQPSDFIILAARPSMGKTALALNIAQNVALRGAGKDEAPKRVAFFSLEMSRDQLVQRMICTEADLETGELRPRREDATLKYLKQADAAGSQTLHATTKSSDGMECGETHQPVFVVGDKAAEDSTAEERKAVAEETQKQKQQVLDRIWMASDKLAGSSIYIDDTPGLTIQEMRGKARRLKAKGGLDLIVIDYLQLMQAPDRRTNSENRQHEVSEISRGLKALARELNVPVLALSQLSRSVETRQVKKPMLSDLRESGSLEQDADIVMFLYREDYYKNAGASPVHLTELIIAKHRNGPTGKVNLFFKNDCTKFIGLNERDAV